MNLKKLFMIYQWIIKQSQIMNILKKMYKIFAVPLFTDNYSYIISGSGLKSLSLVDPANPDVIIDCLHRFFPQHTVNNILYTHKHWDHAGGADQLVKLLNNNNLKIYIGQKDAQYVKVANCPVQGDKQLQIDDAQMWIYSMPCHTRGHVIYHLLPLKNHHEPQNKKQQKMITNEGKQILQFEADQCVFTGDTLFSGGIGRFFEGQAHQMLQNLQKIHDKIPKKCSIFNGHQYTLSNLKWGSMVQEKNEYLKNYLKQIEYKSSTLPTTLERQSEINLFYRVITGTPLSETISSDKVLLMKILRQMKNQNIFHYQKTNL